MRASAVVKRQLTVTLLLLRSSSHAATSALNVSWSAMRRSRHCRLRMLSSISAIFSQLPCLGVWWNSNLSQMRFASSGSNVAYNDAGLGVFRLSSTTVIRSASGKCTSTNSRMQCAQSRAVLWSVTCTGRQFSNGAKNMNRLLTPLRSYSVSYRAGSPGLTGSGVRTSLTCCLLLSSKQTWGCFGSCGLQYPSNTSSIWATNAGFALGGMHHSLLSQGLRSFFQNLTHGLMGEAIELLKLDQVVG